MNANTGNTRVLRDLVLGFLLVNMLIAAWLANALSNSRTAYVRSAVNATQNMAVAMDQSIAGSVDNIDLALLGMQDFLEDRLRRRGALDVDEVNSYLIKAQKRLPYSNGIRATNAAGLVVFGADVDPKAQASWAERDFFVAFKADGAPRMTVTNPIFGKVTQQWVLTFVRRYNHPDGSFAGVISASIPVWYLDGLLQSLKVGPFGIALLRDSNLGLIARAPATNVPAGQLGAKGFSPELNAAIQSGEQSVSFHTRQTSDGVERTSTYRRLSRVPFHLVIGLGAADYLADWNVELRNSVIELLVFMLVTASGIWLLYRSNARERSARQLMLSALDAAGEAFVMYDDHDRLVYCNDRYFELYANTRDWIVMGAKFEEMVRWAAERGIYRDAIGRVDAFVAERLTAHQAGNTEVITRLEDGRTIRVLDRRMANGYTVGFRLDITELTQATDRAEASARSKAQFLANMSHEIRTPMNAILGMLSLIQRTDLDAQQRDYTSKTQGAANSLLGLLNDILDFSKVEAGKMALESEPFSTDALLCNLSVLLSASVGTKDIELLYDLDPDLPDVLRGDAMRLQQVLLNLCGNAIKFTPQGQVVLALRKLARTDAAVTLEFSVQDTGIGIAPEHQAHIFSGFSQAEGSTTRRFGGTGLGLAISQRLVELMGGHIQIHSVPGAGSRFAFVLELPTVIPVPPGLALPLPGRLRAQPILVVYNNPLGAALTLQMLRAWGCTAELAGSGAEALQKVEDLHVPGTPDFAWPVIYMDSQLPDMDGGEATRLIRARARQCRQTQPTVIMVASHGRDTPKPRSPAEQGLLNGLLVKPVTASMLHGALLDVGSGQTGLRLAASARSGALPLKGMRILVVEDNPINQQVADELLRAEGAQVVLAANGQLGVDAVAAAPVPFDAVLMDVQMPVLDGYGATRAIRKDLGQMLLPIIAMTANAMASDREACLAAGMNEHIGKPFDMATLVLLLVRMTGWQAADAVQAASEVAPQALLPLSEVEGLDLAAALGRLSGMRALYVRMAQDFHSELDTLADSLARSLAAGDQTTAVMRLHTLKGNAGTLGATALAALAAALEARCKQAGALPAGALAEGPHSLPALADCIAATQRSLAQAIAQLGPVPLAGDAPASDAAAKAAARESLQRIASLAAADDMAALLCFAEARESLSILPEELLIQLDQALQDLDLEAARGLCESYGA